MPTRTDLSLAFRPRAAQASARATRLMLLKGPHDVTRAEKGMLCRFIRVRWLHVLGSVALKQVVNAWAIAGGWRCGYMHLRIRFTHAELRDRLSFTPQVLLSVSPFPNPVRLHQHQMKVVARVPICPFL